MLARFKNLSALLATCIGISVNAYSSPLPLLKEWFEPITYRIYHKKLSSPVINNYQSKPSDGTRKKEHNNHKRNLIISLGRVNFSDTKELTIQRTSSKNILKKINKNKVKRSLLNYKRPFLKKGLYEEKSKLYQLKEWDLERSRKNLKLAIQFQEGKEFSKQIEKVLPKLNLNWDIIYEVDIDELKMILASPSNRHVIIIAHGNEQGVLYDYDLNPYPKTIFTSQNQTVQSIALFSCFSKNAGKRYRLESENIHSLYKQRYYFHLEDPKNILSKKGTIYSNGLGHFIRKVDQYIYEHASNDEHLKDIPTREKNCSITISGMSIQSGLLLLQLNKTWIGTLKNRGKSSYDVKFDCSILKEHLSNTLLITHAKPFWYPQAKISDFSLTISNLESSIVPYSIKHFNDTKGKYVKSKIIL